MLICYNPDAAVRDAAVREDLIAKPDETIAGVRQAVREEMG